MAKSIAGFKKLQALSLDLGYRDYEPLHTVKNLKHLALRAYSQTDLPNSLLLNSRSTLRSLDISIYSFAFLNDWAQILNAAGEDTTKQHYLTSIESLSMEGTYFDLASVRSLMRAIDFARLRELVIKCLPDNSPLLFEQLADMFSTANTTGSEVHLRSLTIDMGVPGYNVTDSQKQAATDVKCRFLSSFDTLKVLDLADYGQYRLEVSENPGLPDVLLQAILQHKTLERLSISYTGVVSGYQLPYLTPATIASLIDNLPLLREIDIAPEEHDLVRRPSPTSLMTY
jgi:hypothetical protein